LDHHPGSDLGARTHAELGPNVVDVRFDPALAKHQAIGDLTTRQSIGDQRCDLALTCAEAAAASSGTGTSAGPKWPEARI